MALSGGTPELRTVEIFLVLADRLSFARTAEHMGLTTSRISQEIRVLERYTGTALFARTTRAVSLTPAGRRLRDELEPAFERVQHVLTAHRKLAPEAREVCVGVFHTTSLGPVFPEAARRFEAKHPDSKVRYVDLLVSQSPIGDLHAGKHDLYALGRAFVDHDPSIIAGPTLQKVRRVVAVADSHPLAARSSVRYEELGDELMPDETRTPRSIMDDMVPPRTPSGRQIRRQRTEDHIDIMTLVSSGRMVFPTLDFYAEPFQYMGITCIPIEDLPLYEFVLCWRHDARRDPAIDALLDDFEALNEAGD